MSFLFFGVLCFSVTADDDEVAPRVGVLYRIKTRAPWATLFDDDDEEEFFVVVLR